MFNELPNFANKKMIFQNHPQSGIGGIGFTSYKGYQLKTKQKPFLGGLIAEKQRDPNITPKRQIDWMEKDGWFRRFLSISVFEVQLSSALLWPQIFFDRNLGTRWFTIVHIPKKSLKLSSLWALNESITIHLVI